jgi:hypothetical protein
MLRELILINNEIIVVTNTHQLYFKKIIIYFTLMIYINYDLYKIGINLKSNLVKALNYRD